MRTRITLAFVAVLAIALTLAGAVSLLLVRHAAANSARATVLRQVQALANSTRGNKPDAAAYEALLPFFSNVVGIKQASIVIVTSSGSRVSYVSSPPLKDISPFSSSELQSIVAGKAISGVSSHFAYAAAALFSLASGTHSSQTVGIALESAISFSSSNIWYFLLAGGISLIVAGALAAVITRRISGYVVAASQAAQQIAGGDLGTRIAASPQGYPELAGLGISLNTMAENLERSQHLQRQFLLSVSHDLRTPLTSIRGYAEAIAEGIAEDLPRAANVLVAEAARLERLIGDLLDLARIEARQFSLHLGDIDAASIVASTTDGLRYRFATADVDLVLHVPSSPVIVVGDGDRLGQIVANLVDNALKFAQHHVDVTLTSNAEEIVISVLDDGPGIAIEDQAHVFERLYTSERHAARAAGTGLGLAIVAELTDAMGGLVAVRSPVTDHRGTELSVRLRRTATPIRTANDSPHRS